jgi:TrmH family RNA methyltransferase
MQLHPIQSAQNPNFQQWKESLTAAGIREHKTFIQAGRKLVREFLHHHRKDVACVLFPPGLTTNGRIQAQFQGDLDPRSSSTASLPFPELSTYLLDGSGPIKPRIYQLSARLFETLDVFGTGYPLVVGYVPDAHHQVPSRILPAPRGLEVILALQDPANLGAAIRSCTAMNARRLILTRECASPYLPKALRAASGMTFQIEMVEGLPLGDYVNSVDKESLFVRALDRDGENLMQAKWPKDIYLILGEEGRGLGNEYRGPALSITMKPGCESLNAVQALTVALFRHAQQHGTDAT